MPPHAACKVAVRLLGLLIAGLSFPDTWAAAHRMFFYRVYFARDFGWLWPFSSYDPDALNDLARLVQFAFALVLIFRAGFVSRLVMWGIRPAGQCPKCGYDVTAVTGGKCPECGTGLGKRG
jgi:hypothetical protein